MKVRELFETTAGSTSSAGSIASMPTALGKKIKRKPKAVDAHSVDSFNLESSNSETKLIKR